MLFVAVSMTTDPGGDRVDAGVDDGQQAAGGLSTNPNWRRIENDHLIEATDSVSFTSVTLGSLAKLCDLYRGYTIDWKAGRRLGSHPLHARAAVGLADAGTPSGAMGGRRAGRTTVTPGQYAKTIIGEGGPAGRLEVEHIGFSSMGDPEYRYAVYDHHGNILVLGTDLRTFECQGPDARQGMRVLLRYLQAVGYEFSQHGTPTQRSAQIPATAGAWAAAAHGELVAAAAEVDAELSAGLDR